MKALPLLAAVAGLTAAAPPRLAGCSVFPASNPWNQRVDKLPVAADSATIVASIGRDTPLHADFGSGLWQDEPIGIPYDVVTRATPRSRVVFDYADESDRGPYPIPAEGGPNASGDRHAILVDRDACRLFELYDLRRTGTGWHAGSGAAWSLRSNHVRPAGWTSADAAGLPILPGLARYDEVARGAIRHALRFTAPRTRRAYVWPARHFASDSTDPRLPPMGLRLRLKASFDVRPFPRQARIVLVALKRYGMLLADNGSSWFVSGAPDGRWANAQLHTLARVHGADFEVVKPARAVHP